MATSPFASPRMLDTHALSELIRNPQGILAQRLNALEGLTREQEDAARLAVSRLAGHNRGRASAAYLGAVLHKKKGGGGGSATASDAAA
jgi:hypothetical protein